MTDSPLRGTTDGLRQLRAAAVESAPDALARSLASLPALAAGMGLLAMVTAADEQQLETARRVAAELGESTGESDPPRAVALLTLVIVRHLLVEDEALQQLAARLFREADERASNAATLPDRAAARLAGATRLLGVLSSWLDHDLLHAAALDAADGLAVQATSQTGDAALATAHEALADALALLAVQVAAPRAAGEAEERAFEQVLLVAERLALGRG